MPGGLFYFNSLDRSILVYGVSWLEFINICSIELQGFNASSVDPDKMLHFGASDHGLHCLLMFIL